MVPAVNQGRAEKPTQIAGHITRGCRPTERASVLGFVSLRRYHHADSPLCLNLLAAEPQSVTRDGLECS